MVENLIEVANVAEASGWNDEPLVLLTENLVKKYRTRTVVDHVAINRQQGEIVVL